MSIDAGKEKRKREPDGRTLAAEFFTQILKDLWKMEPYFVVMAIKYIEEDYEGEEGDMDLVFDALREHAGWSGHDLEEVKKIIRDAREWWSQNRDRYEAISASIKPIPPSGESQP